MFEGLYFHEVTLEYYSKKAQSTSGKKKMKWIFQTKIDFVTCSKLIINELARCATRSDHVHFANNEQPSFTAAFIYCFGHAKHDLIRIRLYVNWSVQAVNIIFRECYVKFKQTNQIAHIWKLANADHWIKHIW